MRVLGGDGRPSQRRKLGSDQQDTAVTLNDVDELSKLAAGAHPVTIHVQLQHLTAGFNIEPLLISSGAAAVAPSSVVLWIKMVTSRNMILPWSGFPGRGRTVKVRGYTRLGERAPINARSTITIFLSNVPRLGNFMRLLGSACTKLLQLNSMVIIISDQVVHSALHRQSLTVVPNPEVTVPLPGANRP